MMGTETQLCQPRTWLQPSLSPHLPKRERAPKLRTASFACFCGRRRNKPIFYRPHLSVRAVFKSGEDCREEREERIKKKKKSYRHTRFGDSYLRWPVIASSALLLCCKTVLYRCVYCLLVWCIQRRKRRSDELEDWLQWFNWRPENKKGAVHNEWLMSSSSSSSSSSRYITDEERELTVWSCFCQQKRPTCSVCVWLREQSRAHQWQLHCQSVLLELMHVRTTLLLRAYVYPSAAAVILSASSSSRLVRTTDSSIETVDNVIAMAAKERKRQEKDGPPFSASSSQPAASAAWVR